MPSHRHHGRHWARRTYGVARVHSARIRLQAGHEVSSRVEYGLTLDTTSPPRVNSSDSMLSPAPLSFRSLAKHYLVLP